MRTYTTDRSAEMADAIHEVYGTHIAIELENAIYTCMELNSPDYEGGCWAFVTNDNHTLGFWYPTDKPAYEASCENYFTHKAMAPESIGAACTLVALNHLLWAVHSVGNHQLAAKLSDQFHALRNWIFDLSEEGTLDGVSIAGFID